MARTLVELPDEIQARAEEACKHLQISFAELTLRGLEYMLRHYSSSSQKEWEPPKPQRLGFRGLDDAELKREARLTSLEEELRRDELK